MSWEQLWPLLVGAALTVASGLVSGWILMNRQARNAADLALRLRAIEIQEPVLRALSVELSGIEDSFEHLPEVQEPRQATRGSSELAAYLGPWRELRIKVERLLTAWRSEYARDVIDNVLPAAFRLLEIKADDLSGLIERYADERVSVEELRRTGRELLDQLGELREMVDNPTRRTGSFRKS